MLNYEKYLLVGILRTALIRTQNTLFFPFYQMKTESIMKRKEKEKYLFEHLCQNLIHYINTCVFIWFVYTTAYIVFITRYKRLCTNRKEVTYNTL